MPKGIYQHKPNQCLMLYSSCGQHTKYEHINDVKKGKTAKAEKNQTQ